MTARPQVSAASLSSNELSSKIIVASMAGVMAAMLMAALDGTIVETAMPRAIAELNGFEHYTSVITMYLLAATAIVPVVGKLSDLYGRKPFLLAGVAIFVVGSALCGAVTSMIQLVMFRGLQGIGAGFTQAMAFTTIADLFPPARRGRVSGAMGAVFGVATVIGPAVGGFLTDGPGWRWCFYVNVPVGIAAFAILFFFFPHMTEKKGHRSIDWIGAVLLLAGVVPLLLALSWAGRDYDWSSPVIVGLLSVGLLLSGLFLYVESRTSEPILPLSLFRNRVVWTSAAAATLVSMAMYCTTLFIPLFLQAVIGRSATQSGAVLTPLMVSLIAASVTSGQIITRVGRYKTIAVFGAIVTTAGLFVLTGLQVTTPYTAVLRDMMIIGVGLGATMPVFTLASQNAVDISLVGVATSSIQFLRSMGGSLGAAMFGAILTNRFGSGFRAAIASGPGSQIPHGLLLKLENPQALMNPRMAAEIRALGPDVLGQLAPVLTAVKQSLATALQTVFFCAAVLMIFGVMLTLRLVDLPLRKTNRPTSLATDAEPGAAAPMPTPSFEM